MSNNFREELKAVNFSLNGLDSIVILLKTGFNLDISRTLGTTDSLKYDLESLQAFFEKYSSLFDIIDKQCGSEFSLKSNSIKRIINNMRNSIKQLELAVSKPDSNLARIFRAEIIEQIREIKPLLTNIITVPILIDFSKLPDIDWKRIGIPGINYRSRVFLSYRFRDQNPIKDTNQQLIDYYIKPLLEVLEIEPVTARSHLKSQCLVDDDILKLVKTCDGIIGFYTMNDSIANVEHEVANNSKIIALCHEEGAIFPSMRNARLNINFNRDNAALLLLRIAEALKDAEMFYLKTHDLRFMNFMI